MKDIIIVLTCIAILILLTFIGWQFVIPAPALAPTDNGDNAVACTMDARECPDGSFVGRTGPNCEFVCPTNDGDDSVSSPVVEEPLEPAPPQPTTGVSIECTPESRLAEACIEMYAPVCAQVQVECVTAPCNPVPQTFGNSCFACAEERVLSYTNGACEGDDTAF